MTRIVVAEMPENASRDLDVEEAIFGPDVEVTHYAYRGDNKELASICSDADAILTEYVPFTRQLINELQNCKVISVSATGYNSIDLDAAADANISVCCIDEYCTEEVADHALLLMLALARRLTEYHDQTQNKKIWELDSLGGLHRMSDLTLGIVGFGKIGQAIARRARAFGMAVLAFDPYPDEDTASAIGSTFGSLQEIYAQSDIISLNCGLTVDNERLIDSDAFAAMVRRPILINCARGGLIDEDALVGALDSGQISAAGLDVLTDESPDLGNSPFLGRNNVILTPHVAFYSDASMLENRTVSASNIRNVLDGHYDAVRKFVHRAT